MDLAAAMRTEAARNLIDQAQAEGVDLVTVSALEPCVLGTVERGLLIEDAPRTGFWPPGRDCSLKPELGLMLAARCRPAFIVVTEAAERDLHALQVLRPWRPGRAGARDRGGTAHGTAHGPAD
jgi:hypothetical protein